MIGIRADGNNKIGLGHIMRCATIGKAFRKLGEEVVFITADDNCLALLTGMGFKVIILDSAYDDMEGELQILIPLLREQNIERLLIDGYHVTSAYLERLREAVITVYMDDVNAFDYPVDILINYNVFATDEQYSYAARIPEDSAMRETKVLTGAFYAPVREEFLQCRKGAAEEVKDIFLSLGGSDAFNLSVKIILALREKGGWNIHVVCGPFNVHRDELKALEDTDSAVCVYENVKEMWELMERCDLAISAAGSTMYELSVMGMPTVTFSFVENQRRIAEGFDKKGAGICVGHYTKETEESFLSKLTECVNALAKDFSTRNKISERACELVDGNGAGRIAETVLEYKR